MIVNHPGSAAFSMAFSCDANLSDPAGGFYDFTRAGVAKQCYLQREKSLSSINSLTRRVNVGFQ